jgi:uncharacterized SAM-binding protein YcdF (DUF218 family)
MRRTVKILSYIVTLAILTATACAGWIVYFGMRAKPAPADCVIVLGCGLYGSTPSPFLMARLDEGIRLTQEGFAEKIIVSGGQGPGEDITEAAAMKTYLRSKGIPDAGIITEDRSTSTLTNLQYSQSKMTENGLTSAIVVSNTYHLARCSLLSKRLGITTSFSGVRLPQYPLVELRGFLREIAAIAWAAIQR